MELICLLNLLLFIFIYLFTFFLPPSLLVFLTSLTLTIDLDHFTGIFKLFK